MKILNLTKDICSSEQISAGAIEPANKEEVKKLLTFDTIPSRDDIKTRAHDLALIAAEVESEYTRESYAVMIDAPVFMVPELVLALKLVAIYPVYSFSTPRIVENEVNGTKVKMSVSKHARWIPLG